MVDPLRQLERFRTHRGRPERDLSIVALVRDTARAAARTHERLGELIEFWAEVVPEPLARRTAISALRGGVLHVTVDSGPLLYELDRFLRGGGTAELRRRYKGTLTRVRLSVGRVSLPDAERGEDPA